MILECPSCRARYLVPIGSFAGGGRQVRCARCRHQWHARLPTSIDVFVPLPEPVPETAPVQEPTPVLSSSPPSVMPSAVQSEIEGFTANLPAIIKTWDTYNILPIFFKWFWLFVKVVAALALILLWPIMDRQKIVLVMPELRGLYAAFGFSADHSGSGLMFDQVKSELKYDSGMMRLAVDGFIHNTTQEMQFVPSIKARALGPDNHIIQSWQIPAPAATVAAGSDLPLHSEIDAPMTSTIENVTLEFSAQDEKGDAAK